MPRDLIVDEVEMYDIQVAWRRGDDGAGYVQLGVETHNGCSIAHMLTEIEDGQTINTAADFTGLWGTLNEESVSKLIKTLQKAKRQAFPHANN